MKGATLEHHLNAICTRISADRLRAAALPIDATFNIAVYFDTACATTIVDAATVALAHDYSAAIQVVAYPVHSSRGSESPSVVHPDLPLCKKD
ncbi:MAG: hypothetical protein ABI779_27345 [Acidobacteriota bacterium]